MKAEFQDFADQMMPCKGPRTKRPRASPPVGVAVDSSPSRDGDSTKHPPVGVAFDSSPSEDSGSSLVHSPASSCSQMSMATQEDENMAHCLILLAKSAGNDVKVERISCRKSSDADTAAAVATVTAVATTTSVYECKTCNRKFPSFQALGGHRASHSKPKLIPEDHKKSTPLDHQEIQDKTLEKTNKTKIHECLICGSLFFSGQALGGHMRRHRPLHINTTTTMKDASMEDDDDKEKPKPVFTLDLNLPAPDDDEADDEDTTMFEFSDKQQSSAFSTSAMVDCHY
ncbi:zinc finger protein ZAT5-like [Ipomoea triloba]|uniref:zinc finger protein ZAT5-like n=1 Tax=Ipomoea triloba TaxID=35885 RepID=UPI00125DB647|nr:zinc finger protein ZAT5-like [Ipomoea triloba]